MLFFFGDQQQAGAEVSIKYGQEDKRVNKDHKKKKRNALVICLSGNQFWTTQSQFWQWVRDGVIVKTKDYPLTGKFFREHEELTVKISNTILNLACPNHLREALSAKRTAFTGR